MVLLHHPQRFVEEAKLGASAQEQGVPVWWFEHWSTIVGRGACVRV